MCGVCGVVQPGAPLSDDDLDLVRTMCGRMVHRGPDAAGDLRDHHAILGHTRLAIVDAAGGAQPMGDGGDLWVVFNGEIYNHVELRRELQAAGHRFRSHSDTEVIAHAWRRWGPGALRRFNGQWAFALWDARRGRLVLARDTVGVRPLYYAVRDGRLTFASTVAALLADPAAERAFDPAGLAEVLTFWAAVAPRTPYAGIHQLPPGHWAMVDAATPLSAGPIDSAPYAPLVYPEAGTESRQSLADNAAELRAHLERAVRLRFFRSDVPVAAYLSGGLDSSATVALVSACTDAPVDTYSLRFTEDAYDEGSFQRHVAERLGTRHHEVTVAPRDIAEVFPTVVAHAETPLVRAAPAPMYLLSKLVADRGGRVVVTGEGADEVLGGYDIFREAQVRAFVARDPGSDLRRDAVALLYPWLSDGPGRAPAFARQFFAADPDAADPGLSHRTRWSSGPALAHLLHPDLRAGAAGGADVVAELLDRLPAGHERWDPVSRAQWLETTTLLPGYILAAQGDRMLMANSVEGRFPFLDQELMAFAAAIPARHRLLGLDEKHVLKRAVADLVPPEVLARPKQPYRAPDAASLAGPYGPDGPDWIDEVTSPDALEAAGVLDAGVARAVVAKARRRGSALSHTDAMRLVLVLSTQVLARDLLAPPGPPGADPARAHPRGPDALHIDLRTDLRTTTEENR